MLRQIFYLLFVVSFSHFYSQELNCDIIIDARQTGDENLQVFKTLETQLSEFVNNNSWTGKLVRPNEKIDCSMFIVFAMAVLPEFQWRNTYGRWN